MYVRILDRVINTAWNLGHYALGSIIIPNDKAPVEVEVSKKMFAI